ncbi:MAG TPA: tyrosine-type recombinase/integrase, partial [Gaiellaceae bacterium]|nr:tyrosine-type recombinase/integrase [Gaiellaceae bacterium]
ETVHVRGKGGKERVVPLGEEASYWLRRYLRDARSELARGAEERLFLSARGRPLDTYGRVVYLDTFDSAYGTGWRRENAFVARNPDGTFCYGFVPHVTAEGERRPPGNGSRYRVAVSGPGVTPDVAWEGTGLSDFDRANTDHVALEARMNDLQRTLMARSSPCHV